MYPIHFLIVLQMVRFTVLFDDFVCSNLALLGSGAACFACEEDVSTRSGSKAQHGVCYRCENRYTAGFSGPRILEHMGSHVLHDPVCKGETNICGLCLGTGSSCVIYLTKPTKHGAQIDMTKSRCPNLYKITMKKAGKSTSKSPCSNIPVSCPLCPSPPAPAVWKYNFEAHFTSCHPSANVDLHRDLFELDPDEDTLMKKVFLNRKTGRVTDQMRKKAQAPHLRISDAHRTRLTHTYAPLFRIV